MLLHISLVAKKNPPLAPPCHLEDRRQGGEPKRGEALPSACKQAENGNQEGEATSFRLDRMAAGRELKGIAPSFRLGKKVAGRRIKKGESRGGKPSFCLENKR